MKSIRLFAFAAAALMSCAAHAHSVPPVKGNDTGGIIAFEYARAYSFTHDVKMIAVDHCARYGKVAKFLGAQQEYGGYISFACRWVPYGADERPLRVRS